MDELKYLCDKTQELAGIALNQDGVECLAMTAGNMSCVHTEGERRLTATEKRLGWARRPFYAYDTERLCAGCRAYWQLSMAAQELHRLACLRERLGGRESEKL